MNQPGKVWRLPEGSLLKPIQAHVYAIASAEFAAESALHISIDDPGLTLPIIPYSPIARGRYEHDFGACAIGRGGFLMGYSRGAITPMQSVLLCMVLVIGLLPGGGVAQDANKLSLQLVSGQRAPQEELKVDTLYSGTSQKKTRDEATQKLPTASLPVAYQQMVNSVVQNTSMYRRLPTIRCRVDHRIYRFFSDHPDVAVSLWRAMGVSKLQLRQTGEFEYEADAKDGTVGVISILSRTPTECLVHCHGMFQSPMLTKPIQARAIMHVRTAFEVAADGQQIVTHNADMFVAFPSQTIETIAKAMAPISNKITDKNFEEITLFVRMMQMAMTQQPGWVEQMAGKMDGVLDGRADALLEVTAQCYIDEKRRQGQVTGTPISLKSIQPPVAAAPAQTMVK
jgi:hypothetical protein